MFRRADALSRASLLPWCIVALATLSACSSAADFYPPPQQVEVLPEFRPYRSSRVVEMGPLDADRNIVSGILGSSGTWRWTGRRPTVRLRIRSNEDLKFVIDYAVADATFKDTGPVNISFWVNDHKLGEEHFDQPGEGHFEAPVPAEWVPPDSEAIAAAEIDTVWVAPTDGVELGFILTRMGLAQTIPEQDTAQAIESSAQTIQNSAQQ